MDEQNEWAKHIKQDLGTKVFFHFVGTGAHLPFLPPLIKGPKLVYVSVQWSIPEGMVLWSHEMCCYVAAVSSWQLSWSSSQSWRGGKERPWDTFDAWRKGGGRWVGLRGTEPVTKYGEQGLRKGTFFHKAYKGLANFYSDQGTKY